MSAASSVGVLHIIISTFSPRVLTASDFTSFCVFMMSTISVQYGVGYSAFGSGSSSLRFPLAFFNWWRMMLTIQYESSPRKGGAARLSSVSWRVLAYQ